MTYVIGVTGGIGSGKTLISDRFAELGVPVIDTDVIARQIVEPGQITLNALFMEFGKSILLADGHLDRNNLRELAFSSPEKKQALDRITHPAIRQETLNQINAIKSAYCLVVVPLLKTDSTFLNLMQRVLVVTASQDVKIERVKKRSNLSKEQVLKIMNTQLDDSDRLSFSDDIIRNENTIEDAYKQVETLHKKYSELASSI